MNLLVNRLPSPTWNRLGMNESHVSLEGEFESYSPKALSVPGDVRWEPDASDAPQSLTGTLSALTRNAGADVAETAQGVRMDQPLVLAYDYQRDQQAVSRLILHAAKDSCLKVVLVLTSPMASRDVTALQTQIYADESARVELSLAQLLGNESLGLNEIVGLAQDYAQVDLTRLELGAKEQYTGVNMDLKGREAAFETSIAYHCLPQQILDMNYVALHHGKKTTSLMEVDGTLEENARKIFRGTIDFQQGCAGAKGTESENVLLMGDEMVNQTVPLILCKEEDVEGNHGASIGQLDEKMLFYLETRGISREAAQQMIAQARIEAVCSKIPVEAIQQQVRDFETTRGISHEPEL